MMQFLGFLFLVFLSYTVGLDRVFGALDSVDQHLRSSYDHAVKLHPPRQHAATPAPAPAKRKRAPWRPVPEGNDGR